jgi:hypothetical protein
MMTIGSILGIHSLWTIAVDSDLHTLRLGNAVAEYSAALPDRTGGYLLAIAVIVGWIASVCLHEFGHAIVAYWGGDTTVKDKGYLTLNPLKYTDIGYSLALPVVFLILGGIALPGAAVYINHTLLRSRAWNSAIDDRRCGDRPFATVPLGMGERRGLVLVGDGAAGFVSGGIVVLKPISSTIL